MSTEQEELNALGARCVIAGYPHWSVYADRKFPDGHACAWEAIAEADMRGDFYTGNGPSALMAMCAMVRALEMDRPPKALPPSPPLPKAQSWAADVEDMVDAMRQKDYWPAKYAAAVSIAADLKRQVAELTAKLEARK